MTDTHSDAVATLAEIGHGEDAHVEIAWSDEDQGYILTDSERPGLAVFGATTLEACQEYPLAGAAWDEAREGAAWHARQREKAERVGEHRLITAAKQAAAMAATAEPMKTISATALREKWGG